MKTTRQSSESKEKLKKQDEKAKTPNPVATPRNFLLKSTTEDIYAQKKKRVVNSATKAPKKMATAVSSTNITPMKEFLKSSPSSVSQLSTRSVKSVEPRSLKKQSPNVPETSKRTILKTDSVKRNDAQPIAARRVNKDVKTPDTVRKSTRQLPNTSVTVNSPPVRRKLNLEQLLIEENVDRDKNNKERVKDKEPVKNRKEKGTENVKSGRTNLEREKINIENKNLERGDGKDIGKRHRNKTRTLDDNEVKVLIPDAIDNNAEMLNLKKQLIAKPKAFYVDLDEGNKNPNGNIKDNTSEEDYSYEDDFESYESDFESYHSEASSGKETEDQSNGSDREGLRESDEGTKEGKDEENMLDSGSFDLRESQRSAHKTKPPVMDFILEASEDTSDDKKTSLTDEGFQEMSSSSVSSMKTVHVDVLDRPLFIDFTKSKEKKRKKKLNNQLKQRATDLLGIIHLQEISYVLFEMKAIAYDLFMATFGRSNYTQISVQTYDDGVTEEIQTEPIPCITKWTQFPIEFSRNEICFNTDIHKNRVDEDYLTKFSALLSKTSDVSENDESLDKEYKNNQLRVYFEQKDGVGSNEMLPYVKYNAKLKNNDYNPTKLNRFLKKVESRVSNILNRNSDDTGSDIVKASDLPFSRGYVSISTKYITDEDFNFLINSKISSVIISETASNIVITVHMKQVSGIMAGKCLICLWDAKIARKEPIKVLVAIDNVKIGKFRGNIDGMFVAVLEDDSLHLWDLTEEPHYQDSVATGAKPTKVVDNSDRMTQTELDREWNQQNRHIGFDQGGACRALHSCAYTSSADASCARADAAVGLQLDTHAVRGDRKLLGQVCVLQRIGVLVIWSILQDKPKIISRDLGKAFWSKIKLEKHQIISLKDHFDTKELLVHDKPANFNLDAARRRLYLRKQERSVRRQNSAASSKFESDRTKTVLPGENVYAQTWESGVVCYDLKIMNWDKMHVYLVAKNCGEVLVCKRNFGALCVERFCVANDVSAVTCVEASPHSLPYFLAATDSGTVNLCCLSTMKVLLTLDVRNSSITDLKDKVTADHKGRYVSGVSVQSPNKHAADSRGDAKQYHVRSVYWSHWNPCCIHAVLLDGAVVSWELTHSDIHARHCSPRACVASDHAPGSLALVSTEGEVLVHRLSTGHSDRHMQLFRKYVTLL